MLHKKCGLLSIKNWVLTLFRGELKRPEIQNIFNQEVNDERFWFDM